MDIEKLNDLLVEETKREFGSEEIKRLFAKWSEELAPICIPKYPPGLAAGGFWLHIRVTWEHQGSRFSEDFEVEFVGKPKSSTAECGELDEVVGKSKRVAIRALARALDGRIVVRYHRSADREFTTLDILLEEGVYGDVIVPIKTLKTAKIADC